MAGELCHRKYRDARCAAWSAELSDAAVGQLGASYSVISDAIGRQLAAGQDRRVEVGDVGGLQAGAESDMPLRINRDFGIGAGCCCVAVVQLAIGADTKARAWIDRADGTGRCNRQVA